MACYDDRGRLRGRSTISARLSDFDASCGWRWKPSRRGCDIAGFDLNITAQMEAIENDPKATPTCTKRKKAVAMREEENLDPRVTDLAL